MRNWKSHTRAHTHTRPLQHVYFLWRRAQTGDQLVACFQGIAHSNQLYNNVRRAQMSTKLWCEPVQVACKYNHTSNQKLINKQRPRLSAILVSGRSRAWPRSVLLQIYYNFFAPVFSGKKTCGRSPAQNSLTTLDRGGN